MNLDNCIEITPSEYINLINPIFKGQTRLDDNDMYWMCFESEGIMYKIHNKL